MLTETARVVAVEQDGVWVETMRTSTCGTCAAQKGCGHGILNRISEGHRSLIRVLPGQVSANECRVDDEVRISIPEEVILKGSFVVYILPVLLTLIGAALASSVLPQSPDIASIFGALGGFILGFALVRWHAWIHRQDQSLQPILVEVLHCSAEPVTLA